MALSKVTWTKPHLLLLDEPSNHLDLDAVEALVQVREYLSVLAGIFGYFPRFYLGRLGRLAQEAGEPHVVAQVESRLGA